MSPPLLSLSTYIMRGSVGEPNANGESFTTFRAIAEKSRSRKANRSSVLGRRISEARIYGFYTEIS